MPSYETPEKREAREAAEGFRAGTVPLHEYVSKQPAGTKIAHGGKQYLSSLDGPRELTHVPLGTITQRTQKYRNPEIVGKYKSQFQNKEPVEPVTLEPATGGKGWYVRDGHHRVEGAEAAGLSHVHAWVPMSKPPVKLARRLIERMIRKARGDAWEGGRQDTSFSPAAITAPVQPLSATHPHVFQHLEPHEEQIVRRSKGLAQFLPAFAKHDDSIAFTWAGRHARPWYDVANQIMRMHAQHSNYPHHFLENVGAFAAASARTRLLKNEMVTKDIQRLRHIGAEVNGVQIPPFTKDPNLINLLIDGYKKANVKYPANYPFDPTLRGKPLVTMNDMGNRVIHVPQEKGTENEWAQAPPIMEATHAKAIKFALGNPETLLERPYGVPTFSRKPEKTYNFSQNLLGNGNAHTADVWEAAHRGIGGDELSGGLYHIFSGAGRHVAHSLNKNAPASPLDRPHFLHGWNAGNGQAARWVVGRAIQNRVARGETPEQAAHKVTAGEVWDNASWGKLYEHPQLIHRMKAMEHEGSIPANFHKEVERIEDAYRPTPDERNQVVGGPQLVTTANQVHQIMGRGPTQEKIAADRTARKQKLQRLFRAIPEPIRKSVAFGAASPNIDNLSFDEALHRLQGDGHKAFRQMSAEMAQKIGLHPEVHDALGDWSDGAENSLAHVFREPVDDEKLTYLLAWLGKLGRQKSILKFMPHRDGPHHLMESTVPEADLGRVRKRLDAHGVAFRTLIPSGQGTKVLVADLEGNLVKPFTTFAGEYRAPIHTTKGTGEFIGADSREDAAEKFNSIIHQYDSKHGLGGGQGTGNSDPSSGTGGPRQSQSGGVVSNGQFHQGGTFLPKPL